MSATFSILKSFTVTAHMLCLLSGLAALAVHIYGLENAKTNSMEHTFYIMGVIISAFAALFTIFGLHGALCELLGVSIVYAFLLLCLFMMQVQQIRSFQPQIFILDAQVYLERSWHVVNVRQDFMQNLEKRYHCCALNGPVDYMKINLTVPSTCTSNDVYSTRGCLEGLQINYSQAMLRENLSNWCLITVQLFSYILTLIFCVLLYKRPYHPNVYVEPAQMHEVPHLNHVDSRLHLLSS